MTKVRRNIRLTSYGKIAAFLSIFLLFSAQNTGNNLLFLMSSCFIAAVLFFTWLAYLNVVGIEARFELPETTLADEDSEIKCLIRDYRNTEHFCLAFEGDFCRALRANDSTTMKTMIRPRARGKHRLANFCVFSFYPLGLCSAAIFLPEQELFVGPRPAQNIPEVIDQEIGGAIQKYQSGKEGEYWMQKQYEPGEDASLINWTISARSDTEWVLTRALNYGFPEKLYFDFSGLEGQIFEDCLEIVMGLILRLKKAGSSGFIWAEQKTGEYGWLTVTDNYSELVRWLAKIESSAEIPLPAGEFHGIVFAELMKEVL